MKISPESRASQPAGKLTRSQSMFCSNCGKQITENDKFCPACGKPAGAEEELNPASPAAAARPVQPAPAKFTTGGPAADVPDHTAFSILVTVFGFFMCCCVNPVTPLLGIVAIIVSSNSRRKLREGDITGALSDANTARLLCLIAAALFAVIWAARILLQLFGHHPIIDYNMMHEFQRKFGRVI